MSIFINLVKKFASLYGLDEAVQRLEESFQLGESSSIQIPKEIASESLEFASRGLLNMNAIQPNLDWVMPFWVNRQYNADSDSYVPGTGLSTNQTHRNWTGIGWLDSDREPVVDPTGLLTPFFDGWSVEFWLLKNDYLIVPSRNNEVYQYLVKQLPIVVSQFIKKEFRLRIEAFVSQREDGPELIFDSIDMVNLESRPIDASLFVTIRPYNPEGISTIREISFDSNDQLFYVNGSPGVYLPEMPARILCSNRKMGDVSFKVNSEQALDRIVCPQGLATAMAEFKLSFKPGEAKHMEVRCPVRKIKPKDPEFSSVYANTYQEMKRDMIVEWDEVMSRGLNIHLPYQKMDNAFRANKAHLYMFIDGNVITPGPFTYHHEWFRDAAYSVPMLDKLGYHAEAERILLNYPNRQRKDGYFLSQEGEWDANGQALWTYYKHYLYTRNVEFLKEIFSSAWKGFRWIQKNREEKTGLLPAGFSAEHFGPNDTFYWDNFWSIAGIRGFITIAEVLRKDKEADEARNLLEEYSGAVFGSIAEDEKRFGFPVIPASPNRSVDASIVGSICALYPLRLVDPQDVRMTGTLRVIRRKYMENHAFFHRVIHSGYNVYLTSQIAQCYLFQRSSRVLPILHWIMDNITRTGTFPEAIHPVTGGGCYGDGHHGWAAADFLSLVRNLLYFEENDSLVICPVVYHRWMEAEQCINVENGITWFGKLSFQVNADPEKIILNIDSHFHTPPRNIEFTSPFPVSHAEVDGKPVKCHGNGMVKVPGDAGKVILYRK